MERDDIARYGEYLAGEKLLQEDPQELLEDVDAYIRQYAEDHAGNLTFAELTGIGRYYLAKYHNRPDAANKRVLLSMGQAVLAKLNQPQSINDTRVSLDALEILDECGADISGLVRSMERLANQAELPQLEQVYCLFRLYVVTRDEYLYVRVREGLKNLAPQLMSLTDALMLAEMLYFTLNCNHNER